jgi:hypothetical protein
MNLIHEAIIRIFQNIFYNKFIKNIKCLIKQKINDFS